MTFFGLESSGKGFGDTRDNARGCHSYSERPSGASRTLPTFPHLYFVDIRDDENGKWPSLSSSPYSFLGFLLMISLSLFTSVVVFLSHDKYHCASSGVKSTFQGPDTPFDMRLAVSSLSICEHNLPHTRTFITITCSRERIHEQNDCRTVHWFSALSMTGNSSMAAMNSAYGF